MEFSDRGIPILTLQEKCRALTECVEQDAWEDVMGHLFDLMHHGVGEVSPFSELMWGGDAVMYLYLRYGQGPTPILDKSQGMKKSKSCK